jgi:PmbA protein
MVKAERDGQSVVDSAQTIDRRINALDSIGQVAATAVQRALSQLGGRSLPTQRAAIIFDARIASALLGDLVWALGGTAQFRRTSLFQDAIGTRIAPDHIDLTEDPFQPFGLASGGYDREGVAGQRRHVIEGGVVRGYFLDSRAGRRLSMSSTGNADGPWNLRLASRATPEDRGALCARMGRGLLVTQLNGGATDPVTGNWTRAVTGLWVEGGEPAFPVSGVTVGGNLRDMIGGIVTIGSDLYRQGAFQCGSILIHDLQIGGAA